MSTPRRIGIVVVAIGVLMLAARALLPLWVRAHVNGVLARAEGYTGRVADVDLALYRGAYRIEGLEIHKDGGRSPSPCSRSGRPPISPSSGKSRSSTARWSGGRRRSGRASTRGRPDPRAITEDGRGGGSGGEVSKSCFHSPSIEWPSRTASSTFVIRTASRPSTWRCTTSRSRRATSPTAATSLRADRPGCRSTGARSAPAGAAAESPEVDPFAERPTSRLKLELVSLQLTELDAFRAPTQASTRSVADSMSSRR